MIRRIALAALGLAAGLAAGPAAAQYYYNPGPGYYQPAQPQIYLPPEKAQRNLEKLSRKQAEFYRRYGYPRSQMGYRAPPQTYRNQNQPPYGYGQPYGYAQPYGYGQPQYAPPPRTYRGPPGQYYYDR